MNYTARPGIVTAQLCGMNVLIPSRITGDACKTILPLTLMGAIVWTGIQKDYPIEKVLEAFRIFSKKPDEELIEKIDSFCEKLYQKGFIISKEAPTAEVSPS